MPPTGRRTGPASADNNARAARASGWSGGCAHACTLPSCATVHAVRSAGAHPASGAETPGIGAQAVAQYPGIAPVVLGPGDRKAVPEAVELLGIEGVNREAALHQTLHDRAVGQFDANGEALRSRARGLDQPSRQRGQFLAIVAHRALPAHRATIIDQADLMNLARPVDADIPVKHLTHRRAPIHMGRRSLDPPLYWRSFGADSPLGLSRGLPPGHASPPGVQDTGGKGLLPADRPNQSTALQYRRPLGP